MAAEDYISFGMWDDFSDDSDQSREPVVIKYEKIIGESRKAFKIKIQNQDFWMPKSYTTIHPESNEITIPTWLFQTKGLK